MKTTKKILSAALAGLCTIAFTACSSKTSTASAGSAAKTEEKKTSLIGISPDYPPYDDVTTDGQLTGFDYDMGEWLFKWMNENGYNYDHEWKQQSFDTIISSLGADQIDLGISGFTYDKDRQVEFSEPYLESAEVAMVTKDSPLTSSDDLKGKTIAAQLGTTGESCANEIEGADVKTAEDMGIIIESLKGGAYDAVILDKPVAENYASTGDYKILDGELLDEKNYVIAKEGNTELMEPVNKAIKAFVASSDYKDLCDKYGLSAELAE